MRPDSKPNRILSVFLAFAMALTQILPAGFAETVLTTQEPGDPNVPVVTLEESEQQTQEPKEELPPSDYEQFLGQSPISDASDTQEVIEEPEAHPIPIEEIKRYAFEQIDRIGQQNHFTIQDAETLHGAQLGLKRSIEALPEDERQAWIDTFNDFLKKSDQIFASKPLLVVLADGSKLTVSNPTNLMMQIIQRYKMMDQNGEVKLDRLAGIDPEDLIGLEALSDYVKSRQIGTGLSIPLFDLYSPYAAPHLIDRLVRKFASRGISRTEGTQEIVSEDLLRYVDGTKPAFDAAMKAADEVFAQFGVEMPSSPLTLDSIMKALNQMAALNENLVRVVREVLDAYQGENVFKNMLRSQIGTLLMYGPHEPAYGQLYSQLNNLLYNADITYQINGKTVKVSLAELNSFTNGLPYEATNLYRYPGVKTSVDPSILENLVSQDFVSKISFLNFNAPANSVSQQNFSFVARRFQLLDVFLKTWGDVISDAKVDFDRLRFHLLISYDLEKELGRAEEYIKNQTVLMNAYLNKPLSEADYQVMKNLLQSANEELVNRFKPLLQDVIYDTTNEVTARVQLRFQELINAFSNVLNQAPALVVDVNGQSISFDPKSLRKDVLDRILNATSIAQNGGYFDNASFIKISGIDAAIMDGLVTREEMSRIKQINFNTYVSSWKSGISADEEILFNLIPQLVKKFGTSNAEELTEKLSENVYLPVPLGQNLRETVKQQIINLSQQALDRMGAVSVKTIEDLLKMRDIFKQYHSAMSAALEAFVKSLTPAEKSILQGDITSWSTTIVPNFRDVTIRFQLAVSNVDILEVAGVRVSVRQIAGIVNFPNSKNFDHELFSGLMDEDFAGVETSDEYSKYGKFTVSSIVEYLASSTLSALGRIQVIVNAAARILNAADAPQDLTFINAAGQKEINAEAFRKYIKGVVRMQQETIAEAERRALAMAEELKLMEKSAYTIEEIEVIHQKVLKFRQDLIELLNQKASKHERGDVIQIENQISLIHQKNVFDLFVSMVGKAKLVLAIQGQLVEIPAKAITEGLLAVLAEKKGDSSLAAHDFSMLYGVGVDILRRAHKLENYMGEQMVILPRNSEYVQIVSQLSELGYMQLVVYLVGRYADEVVNDGRVDVVRLLELMSDKEGAISKVSKEAADILDQKVKELEGFDHPLTLEELAKISALVDDAKASWVSLMNDFLSGLNDPDAKERLEQIINDLSLKLSALRDGVLGRNPIVVTIDGRNVQIRITDEMLNLFRSETERYAAETLQQEIFQNALAAGYSFEKLAVYAETQLMVEDYYIQPFPIYKMPVAIWNPLPRYNANHHITDFGLEVLMARLIQKYGEFVVVPNADGELAVDMDSFIKELYLTDEDRSERRIQRILENDIPAMEKAIASMRDTNGAFRIENINQLNELFLSIKMKIIKALPEGYSYKAAEAGAALANLYNGAIMGTLSLEINGRRVTYDAKELSAIIDRLKQNRGFDSEFLKQFSDLLKSGENSWQFNDFLNIPQNYYYRRYEPVYFSLTGIESDESQNETFDGITLGQLDRFAGINASDLTGLDVKEKIKLRLTPIDPLTLMGLLDMRTLAPGSGVSTGGLMTSSQASSQMSLSSEMMAISSSLKVIQGGIIEIVPIDYVPLPVDEIANLYNLMWQKSSRFTALELIPVFIKQLGVDRVTSADGKIDPELFEQALKGDLFTYPVQIDINGKKVNVDMKALVDAIKIAWGEAMQKHSEETGQFPIEGYGMESLLFLKGVSELFTQDEVMRHLTVPVCTMFGERCVISSAPPQYTDENWSNFTTELLRRMDAKGQKILSPINYFADPGPDAPMFSVMNEKVIELVKNGLEDLEAKKKWEEVKAAMDEISAQIQKLKALREKFQSVDQQKSVLEQEYQRLNEILNGRSLILPMYENVTMVVVEVYAGDWMLVKFLEGIHDRLREAVDHQNLEKAISALEDYNNRKSPDYAYVPSFDEVAAELSKMIDAAAKRLEELPGLIEDFKIKITERSRMWEEQAIAALKAYPVVSGIEMLPPGKGYWSTEGAIWPYSFQDYFIMPIYLGDLWTEPRFFKVTLRDGTELKIESRNGILDPKMVEVLENHYIYPSEIVINNKKVSVDMKALVDQLKVTRAEAEKNHSEETGQFPIEGYGMESLLFLKGVSELFTRDEVMNYLTVPVCTMFGEGCVISSAPPQYTDENWANFTAELLRRMDAKGENILFDVPEVTPENFFFLDSETGAAADSVSTRVAWSVNIDAVIRLVKNGLEYPSAKKWEAVKNTLAEIESQLEKLKGLRSELDVLNQKKDVLEKEYSELDQILAGKRSMLLTMAPAIMVYWQHQVLIDELTKHQASLSSALEAGDLEKALSVASDYEAMRNNQSDTIPDFDDATAEILRLTAQAQQRLKDLSGLIQQLKEKIAIRSKEWEGQAMTQIKQFGDILKDVAMLAEKKDGWEDVPVYRPPATNCQPGYPCVDYAYIPGEQRWVERRSFAITFSDGSTLRGTSQNGVVDQETLNKLEEKKKQLNQPKVSTPPLAKSLPPVPAPAPAFRAPLARLAPLAKVFSSLFRGAMRLFKKTAVVE